MNELYCPSCQKSFPNSPPYRRTGRFVVGPSKDIATCPYCQQTKPAIEFVKPIQSTGIGTRLQKDPNDLTPAQMVLQKLQSAASALDELGFVKFADKVDDVIFIVGKDGLDNTFQKTFDEITKCVHCGNDAKIAYTLRENMQEDEKICDLRKDKIAQTNDYWPHDCCAFATYICPSCAEVTTLHNQA